MKKLQNQTDKHPTLHIFLKFYLPVSLLVIVAAVLLYRSDQAEIITRHKLSELVLAESAKQAAGQVLKPLVQDIRYFSNEQALRHAVSSSTRQALDKIAAKWRDFTIAHDSYEQLRLINLQGKELLRIDHAAGKPVIVPHNRLSNKASRYYVREGLKLKRNEIFISPLDLNIEQQRIEIPHKPMIRLVAPVFDIENQLAAIVVVNFKAEHLLSLIQSVTQSTQSRSWLLNTQGYWLAAENSDLLWGFMLDRHENRLQNTYPDSWQDIQSSTQGQFLDRHGFWTQTNIYPLQSFQPQGSQLKFLGDDYFWTLLLFSPDESYQALISAHLNEVLISTGMVLLLLAFTLWLYASSQAQAAAIEEKKIQAQLESQLKSQFLANMSHELRTPMNGIIGMSHLALQTELTEQQKNYIDKVNYSAQYMMVLINDILDLAKIESGKLEINETEFRIYDLMQNVLNIIGSNASTKEVSLHTKIDEAIPDILKGDAVRTSQILINLCSNAIKFSQAHKQVHIAVSLLQLQGEQCSLKFSVTDQGIGIARKDHEKLFKAFVQADASTSRLYGGTGLGLTISKHLVELMHGAIGFESEENVGSTFYFSIPFTVSSTAEAESERRESNNRDLVQQSIDALKGLKVLLVEDNDINQELVLDLLEHFGIEALLAENGQQAIDKLIEQDFKFDLVLMDCQMPVMDGYEATRIIRMNADLQDMPIIALTANALKGDRERVLTVGMNDLIAKPIDPEFMAVTMAKWINMKSQPSKVSTALGQ